MAVRKWLIRSLFPLLIVAGVAAWYWIYAYVKPSFVRQQLIAHLEAEFPSIQVEVGYAYIRLFGGISVSDLRLIRRDDPEKKPFLVIPSAVFSHDKEAFQQGKIVLRKIELSEPRLRLERFANGKWNVEELFAGKSDNLPPAVVAKRASISFADLRIAKQPLGEIRETDILLINDPKTILSADVQVRSSPLGAFSLQGRWDTASGDWFGGFDFAAITLGPDLANLAAHFAPQAASHLRAVRGTGSAQLKLSYRADEKDPLQHDLKVDLKHCRINHPEIPIEIEDLSVQARCNNGHLIVDRATARSGPALINLSLDLPWRQANIECPSSERSNGLGALNKEWSAWEGHPQRLANKSKANPLLLRTMFDHLQITRVESVAPESHAMPAEAPAFIRELESRLRKLDLTVSQLPLTSDLFKRLPARLQPLETMFHPQGAISLGVEFRRDGSTWSKRCIVNPEGFTATYKEYSYPLKNIRGRLEQSFRSDRDDELLVDLTGFAAGRMVTIKGTIKGDDPELDIDLQLKASGMPLDDAGLIDALPKPYPQLVKRLHPHGKADVTISIRHNAEVRRLYGADEYDNEFLVGITDGRINYEEFPYPLESVQGTVYIRTQPLYPTRLPPAPGLPAVPATAAPDVGYIEMRNFTARHRGSKLKFSGRKEPTTGGSVLNMQIEGEGIEFDRDLYASLSRLQLEHVITTFAPRGRMNCTVRARMLQRLDPVRPTSTLPFNPADDLEMNFAFAGAEIQPIFFPYLLTDTVGRVAYGKRRVEVFDFAGKHGLTVVRLPHSEVILRNGGGFWADINNLHMGPLNFDTDLLSALPPGLKAACTALEMKGPISLVATRMVVDEQPGPPRPRMLPTPEPTPGDAPKLARGYSPQASVPQPDPVPFSSSGQSTPTAEARAYLPTIFWDAKLIFDGATLSTGVPWEDVTGTFATRGLFESERLGRVIANLSFERARIARQPLTQLIGRFEVDPQEPDIVRIPTLHGSLYGGDVGGEARIVLTDPPRFDLKLNATRIRLEELAKQQKLGPKAQLEGLATAQLFLQNPTDERSGKPLLQGGGSIDVPEGKLLNLPHVLDLLKVLKGKPPDETAFEEAKILFRIRGNRVLIGQLDLMGNAVSLGGQGEMNLDGSNMVLEFYTVWTRVNNLLSAPLSDVTAMFSKAFFKMIVKGELGGKTEIKKEAVPFIVEPVKRIVDRVSGAAKSNRERPKTQEVKTIRERPQWDTGNGNLPGGAKFPDVNYQTPNSALPPLYPEARIRIPAPGERP